MEKQEIFKIISEQKKIIEKSYNCKVLFIGLYGSQNYNLDDEQSDIDLKAIVLPKFNDIINRLKISETVDYEHGKIDLKDLLTYYDVVKKGNFSFIEPFHSIYKIGDKELIEMFKRLEVNPKSVYGAMLEKQKALTHEYPSKTEEFKKWGFDPKQLHYIMRLSDLFAFYKVSFPFLSYTGLDKTNLIGIKRNTENWSKEKAIEISDRIINNCKNDNQDLFNNFEQVDISKEFHEYFEIKVKQDFVTKLGRNDFAAREFRTFDGSIPKSDLEKFKKLEEYKGKDVSYIVYEILEIL